MSAVALALVAAGSSLYLPVVGEARQPGDSGSAFCASRAVKTDATAKLEVRLVISRKAVPPGGAVRSRIENHGTVDAAYGLPYRVQRRERSSWVN